MMRDSTKGLIEFEELHARVRVGVCLRQEGWTVNRKRVGRLLRIMGIKAIALSRT